MSPMPAYFWITDVDGVSHVLSFRALKRISMLGTPEAPDLELYIAFGGTIRVAGEHARWLLDHLDNFAIIIRPD